MNLRTKKIILILLLFARQSYADPASDWFEKNRNNLPAQVKLMTPSDLEECDTFFVYSPLDTVHLVYDLNEILNRDDLIPRKKQPTFEALLRKSRAQGKFEFSENLLKSINTWGILTGFYYPLLDYLRDPKNAKAIILDEPSIQATEKPLQSIPDKGASKDTEGANTDEGQPLLLKKSNSGYGSAFQNK